MHTFGSLVLEALRKVLQMDTIVVIVVGLAITLLVANKVDKKGR